MNLINLTENNTISSTNALAKISQPLKLNFKLKSESTFIYLLNL